MGLCYRVRSLDWKEVSVSKKHRATSGYWLSLCDFCDTGGLSQLACSSYRRQLTLPPPLARRLPSFLEGMLQWPVTVSWVKIELYLPCNTGVDRHRLQCDHIPF